MCENGLRTSCANSFRNSFCMPNCLRENLVDFVALGKSGAKNEKKCDLKNPQGFHAGFHTGFHGGFHRGCFRGSFKDVCRLTWEVAFTEVFTEGLTVILTGTQGDQEKPNGTKGDQGDRSRETKGDKGTPMGGPRGTVGPRDTKGDQGNQGGQIPS